MKAKRPRITAALLVVAMVLLSAPPLPAYSVLTHEQVIDFVWERHFKRLLLERYPNATEDDLRRAHAYAYGGCLIQDMGYYPSGNKFFSDLLHYVRSGDFVMELINDAQDINELAFALGGLAHYASDISGHPTVNAAVALEFPRLSKKYGNEVTYADDPIAHIRTEFGFDVLQVAKQRYTSEAYHDFIGFEVAQPLLERAFANIYGIPLKEIFSNEELTLGSYRRAVSKLIPELTRVALVTKKQELEALPNFEPRRFRYLLSRTEYERTWGKNYYKPSFASRFLAFIVRLIPKFGRLRALDIKTPTAQTEKMYIQSVEWTVTFYDMLLTEFETHQLDLPNRDYDTGRPTSAGEYELADKTYAKLLQKHAKNGFAQMPAALRSNLLAYYADPDRPIETKKHKKDWKEVLHDLDLLKAQQSATQINKSHTSGSDDSL
ncbi:MAG TPA: zinc dependent phospholipase C family protein [Candidatus Angelobacter sp.]|nr:zinc dependent phospholipase C family protein [Candidatus Angelobacter sp.]